MKFIVIGIIIILAGVVGYKILIQDLDVPETIRDLGETNTTDAQDSENETLNWQIYKNDNFRFEIKYPSEMVSFEMKSDANDDWYEVTPVSFFEKSARGEFADRFMIKIIRKPLAGDRTSTFTSLGDYINYKEQLLRKNENISGVHFTKFFVNGLEFVKEVYTGQSLQSASGFENVILYSLYNDGLIYTLILGSSNPDALDTYELMVKTFRLIK